MPESSPRPKVLFVTASYPTPESRTSGIFVREHARAAARHADVAVLHLHRVDGARLRPRATRVAGEELPTWRVDYPRRPLALSYAANLAAAVVGVRAVRRAGFRPDLLHAHFFLAAVPAVLVGRALRLPVVTTEQWSVFLPSDPMELGRLPLRLARFAFGHSAAVLPPSEALRDSLVALGVDAPLHVVRNAVDGDLFHPGTRAARGERRLLSVSGLYGAKGYEHLLPAVARLVSRGQQVHLDVVGDGENRAEYERLAADLGLDGIVTFHGERPKREVAAFMRDADLFVLASVYDNNPCAVLEALVSGLPVVSTTVGGVPEIVTSERGVLAEPGDADDLADRIEEALAREDFDRDAIARDAAAEYGLDAVGAQLAEVYRQALRR